MSKNQRFEDELRSNMLVEKIIPIPETMQGISTSAEPKEQWRKKKRFEDE
jgi:hypothetical protein